jgi:hypothetical protein
MTAGRFSAREHRGRRLPMLKLGPAAWCSGHSWLRCSRSDSGWWRVLWELAVEGLKDDKSFIIKTLWMAERVGFEPTVEFPLHTLSKRA